MAAQVSAKALSAAAGKSYWREADARVVVQAWKQSGHEASHFAATHGVEAARLARWAKRLEKRGAGRRVRGSAGAAALNLRFHPVELIGSTTRLEASVIEIVLLDARRVRVPAGFASDDLERVLRVLEECSRC